MPNIEFTDRQDKMTAGAWNESQCRSENNDYLTRIIASMPMVKLRAARCWRAPVIKAGLAGLVALLLLGMNVAAMAQTTVTFTASGNWTAPAGVTSATVQAWGGGGAGGGATGNPAEGGGGAGGQYASSVVTVLPGNNYPIVVGAGGTGSTGDGAAGGDSTFNGATVVAKGGAGGTGAINGVAGSGSTAGGVGTVVYAGGSGSSGAVTGGRRGRCQPGGAGGGGAGSGGAGGDAAGNTAGTGTATGGGTGGAGRNNNGNGNPGSVAGGGGGGACAERNRNRSGGNGGAGQVIISYVVPSSVVSINTADANPTTASSVSWTVTFSASVTGLSSSNFTLAISGLSGTPAITGVSGSGTTWTVTASTGSGIGSLGLNMTNDTGLSATLTNLPFTGQVYSIVGNSGVINTYYPGTASVAAGATSITLGPATGAATPIAAGDTVLIMQMQDATIDSSNSSTYGTVSGGGAGLYEYSVASNSVPLSGGTLNLCNTINAYTNASYIAGVSGQKTFQVIRVPSYTDYTLGAVTAQAWNGSTGGVLALDVTGALTLNSQTIAVDGLGFRGGASRTLTGGTGANTDYRTLASDNTNGGKGEGIAGTPQYVFTAPGTLTNNTVEGYPNGSSARGAPANAAGGATDIDPPANDQNPGGGGGGNGGAGGLGGIGWCPSFNAGNLPTYGCGLPALVSASNPNGSTGGIGGNAVAGLGATRLTMGGGGGGGSTNNGTGTLPGGLSSSGVAGGGIIMVRAGSMTGTATFSANGSNGDNTVANDGGGGAGAGGAVLISAGSGMGGVTITANGGTGGTTLGPSEVPAGTTATPHGPGGGGGGGYVITTGAPASASAAGGANGVSYNYGVLFGAYGSTAGSNGTMDSSLTAAQIPGVGPGTTTCIPGAGTIDHYQLSLASSSVTCVPTTVTVTACNDASSPCTNPSTLLNGTTAVLTTSGGTLGASTVTFDANGVASTTLSYPAAPNGTSAVVSLSGEQVAANNPRQCCANGTICSVANSCATTFNTAGFIFSSSAGGGVATIPTQVAGVSSATTYLRAVKTSSTTQACVAALTGPNSVDFAYECNNPTTCYTSNLMSVNGGSATTIARNNNGSVASYVPVNMTFDANGNAPFTFNYSDAGQVTLWVSKAASGSLLTALTGSSNAFVVKPDHFSISNITCTTVGAGTCAPANATGLNPAASNSAGAAFIQAGQPFTATVTAMTGAATPAPTPNFGRETTPETVKLTPTLVAPAGGAAGTLSGAFGGFVNGAATGTAFTWSEVGIISLTPSMGDGNYLGAGDTVGTTSVNIGRFIPDHFNTYVLSLSGLPMLCPPGLSCPVSYNGFVYSGEPFSVQVVAQNAANATTQNYDGTLGFSKAVALSAWNAVGGGASNPGGGTLNNAVVAAGTFSLGSATVTGATGPNYSLPNPTTPTDIYIRATDSDSVTSLLAVPANSVEGGVGVANGRLRLFNNYGSEKSSLGLSVQAQYWSGKSWVLSSTDSTTTIPATSVALSNYRDSTGAPTGAWTTSASGPGTLSVGQGTLTLSAPSPAGQTGCVDVALNLGTTTQDNSCLANHPAMTAPASSLAWLRGQNGSCPAPADPSATACFGVYSPETTKTIHVRELF